MAAPTQADKARAFAAMHEPGAPLALYNVWDPGSARAVAEAGASAIATGSWSVAAAQGYGDGEQLPLEAALSTAARIVACVPSPVTLDFEGAYAEAPEAVQANVARALGTGVVGINFEDGVVGGDGLYELATQTQRIAAARRGGTAGETALFLNARIDLFLREPDGDAHPALLDEAIARAQAYAEAGANGVFAPGLAQPALIERLCAAAPVPVNVMATPEGFSTAALAGLGVARISVGPHPYFAMLAALKSAAQSFYAA